MTSSIRDLKEFTKLFKVPIPLEREADYYFATLRASPQYREIDRWIELYLDLEALLPDTGKTVRDHKMQAMNELKAYLEETPAYRRFQAAELPTRLKTQKLSPLRAGELLLSIDVVQANYSLLQTFDAEGALGASWQELCDRHRTHPALAASKSFRQILFGNLNPKRSQRLQHRFMHRFAEELSQDLRLEPGDVAFSSHDELVISTESSAEPAGRCAEIGCWLDEQTFEMPLATTAFRLRAFEKGRFVKTQYDLVTSDGPPRLEPSHRSLFGVPGNLFYLEFKRHVLDQPIDQRDLYFWNEHRLAQWVIS